MNDTIVLLVVTVALVIAAAALIIAITVSRDRPKAAQTVDTPPVAPEPETVKAYIPEPRGDTPVTPAPTVDGVTLYTYLVHNHPAGDNVWASVVAEFYHRASLVPTVASYFHRADMPRLHEHFTRALIMVSAHGLNHGTVKALRTRHAAVRDEANNPITPAVYDAVIDTLVGILVEQRVPHAYVVALGDTIAPLRDALTTP